MQEEKRFRFKADCLIIMQGPCKQRSGIGHINMTYICRHLSHHKLVPTTDKQKYVNYFSSARRMFI